MHSTIHIPKEVDITTWLEPREALDIVNKKFKNLEGAIEWIVERLRADRVIAAAESARMDNTDYVRVLMPSFYWKHWAYLGPGVMDFWNGGDITLWGKGGNGEIGRFFGVRFDLEGFSGFNRTAQPNPIVTTEASVQKKNTGGRPRKEYWEDAIVEMFERLFHGTLIPTVQADIEKAMAEWISDKHGDFPSEASIRTRAAKVWKVHLKEG